MTTLGNRLSSARTLNDLTQQATADYLHVSRQTISSWETGRSYPDISSLIAISELYHLSLDDLLKGDAQAQTVFKRRDTLLHRVHHLTWWLFGIDVILAFGCVGFLQGWSGFTLTATWASLILTVMLLTAGMFLSLTRLKWHLQKLQMPRWVLTMFALALLAGAGLA